MQPNILITSAGKRVELVFEFMRELKDKFPGAKVITVDLNPAMAPACRVSDLSFAVPRVTDEHYIAELLRICKENNVKVVVPTIDTELEVLSKTRNRFEEIGVAVLVSDIEFIRTCRDKRNTIKFFETVGIRNPASRNKFRPEFPMFAKPYDGSLSTNIHIIRQKSDLTKEILEDPKLIFMELIDKSEYKEYTVDLYYSKEGNLKCVVPRERIEVRSGEVNKGATRKNHIVNFLRERLGRLDGVRGCICIQVFYGSKDNDIVGIEINPRFGGGYPLSFYAGANFPQYIVREYLLGEELEYSENWGDNTVMLRYDSQVIFQQS